MSDSLSLIDAIHSEIGSIRGLLGRHDAKLLHHAHVVLVAPVLHRLAVGDADDVDLGERHFLSGGFEYREL